VDIDVENLHVNLLWLRVVIPAHGLDELEDFVVGVDPTVVSSTAIWKQSA